ncbi:MAG: hypothetical protein H0W83_05435 [Planctomycetes bacterium]|nr:hypothetical protein [Planctomycetota bacterium]
MIAIVVCWALLSFASVTAGEMQAVLDERDRARDRTEQEYKLKLADADKKALQRLSALAKSAKDIEKIEVYKEMLRIDQRNEEAVKYFSALGTLDATLLSLSKPSSEDSFKEFIKPKTEAEWKALKGLEFKLDANKASHSSDDNTKACTLVIAGLKSGALVRLVMNPADQWTSPSVEDKTQAYWQNRLVVRTGEGENGFTKVSDLKGGIYDVGEHPIEFKTIDAVEDLRGQLRIKVILLSK